MKRKIERSAVSRLPHVCTLAKSPFSLPPCPPRNLQLLSSKAMKDGEEGTRTATEGLRGVRLMEELAMLLTFEAKL